MLRALELLATGSGLPVVLAKSVVQPLCLPNGHPAMVEAVRKSALSVMASCRGPKRSDDES
jgi:hypothetical protein